MTTQVLIKEKHIVVFWEVSFLYLVSCDFTDNFKTLSEILKMVSKERKGPSQEHSMVICKHVGRE